jgi:hypothetical protein
MRIGNNSYKIKLFINLHFLVFDSIAFHFVTTNSKEKLAYQSIPGY